jgi:hypothetical protein
MNVSFSEPLGSERPYILSAYFLVAFLHGGNSVFTPTPFFAHAYLTNSRSIALGVSCARKKSPNERGFFVLFLHHFHKHFLRNVYFAVFLHFLLPFLLLFAELHLSRNVASVEVSRDIFFER